MRLRPFLWTLGLATLLPLPLSWGGEGSFGAEYLNEAVGARAVGMGEAQTAVTDNVNSVYWNPAGLVSLGRTELVIVHTEYLQGIKNEYFAFGTPLGPQDALGFNGYFNYLSGIERSTTLYDSSGSFGTYGIYGTVVYSHRLSSVFSLGVGAKMIYQSIDTYSAFSLAGDLGLLYESLLPNLNLGLTVRNLGLPIKFISESDPLPLTLNFGLGQTLFNKDLLIMFDAMQPLGQKTQLKLGAEYNFEQIIFLRAGYRLVLSEEANDPWAGLTGGFGVEVSDYRIDYALSSAGDLGLIHRIGITFPFDRSILEEEKALAKMEKKIKDRQEDIAREYSQKADEAIRIKNYAGALPWLNKVYAMNPQYPNVKKRIDDCENKIKFQSADKSFLKGKDAFQKGEFINSLVEWNKTAEIMPNYPELGKWMLAVNQRLAETKVQKTGKNNKVDMEEEYLQKGLDYLKDGQYRNAINAWEKVLQMNPGNARAKSYLAKAKAKLQEEIDDMLQQADNLWERGEVTVAAVRMWKQVLKIDPNNPVAISALRTNREKISSYANELYLRGVQNYVQNKLAEAIVNWKDVLVLDPENQKAAKHLARAEEKLKEIETLQK